MDVICLGILIADIFASPIASLPAAGELRLVDRYLLCAGGCAANTAVCLRRLGQNVSVVGMVGEDLLGDFVVKDLARMGIDASAVRRSATLPTSNTYIINLEGEDRRYLHCLGTNTAFGPGDFDFSLLNGADALYFGGYVLMPGFSPQNLATLFQEAKKRRLFNALDVVIGAGTRPMLEWVEPVLPYTDLFLPNNDEARILTGHNDPLEQAEALACLNPNCIVAITLGRNGALVRHQGKVLCVPAYPMPCVDESGAGDAFAAGFITGLLEKWPLEKALRFASAVGASCTRALGCTDGVFRFEEALTFIEEHQLVITLYS